MGKMMEKYIMINDDYYDLIKYYKDENFNKILNIDSLEYLYSILYEDKINEDLSLKPFNKQMYVIFKHLEEELDIYNLSCKELLYIVCIVNYFLSDENDNCVLLIDNIIDEYENNIERISNLLLKEKEYLSKDEYETIFNKELFNLFVDKSELNNLLKKCTKDLEDDFSYVEFDTQKIINKFY